MHIQTLNKNHMGQNIYLCWCGETKEGVIIDAGCDAADVDTIMGTMNQEGLTIQRILLTHGHFDHICGLTKVKKLTNAKVYIHTQDKAMMESPKLNLSTHMGQNVSATADEVFEDGDLITFGECQLKILHTPGHTLGGCCFYNAASGDIFVGDTLFKGSIGRTDFPGGDHAQLIRNIKAKLLKLPEHTRIYPGHGGSSTIGDEKKNNQFLRP